MHVTSFKFYIAQYFLPTGLNAVSGEHKCTYLGLQWIKGGCLRKQYGGEHYNKGSYRNPVEIAQVFFQDDTPVGEDELAGQLQLWAGEKFILQTLGFEM